MNKGDEQSRRTAPRGGKKMVRDNFQNFPRKIRIKEEEEEEE